MHETAQESTRALILRLFRYALYLGLLAILLEVLPSLALRRGVEAFRENGPVEWIQFSILFCTGTVLAGYGFRTGRSRELLCLLGGFLYVASAREMDSVFEYLGLHWSFAVAAVIVAEVFYLRRRVGPLTLQIKDFARASGFGMLWAGLAQAVVIAQLIGHGGFLRHLMGGDYTRSYKRVVEETGELCGYVIILFGAVETIFFIRERAVCRRSASSVDRQEPEQA